MSDDADGWRRNGSDGIDASIEHGVREADQLRDTLARLDFTLAAERAQMALVRAAVEAFIETVNAAVQAARPSQGGQHVPYHGDFCAAGPSVLGRLQWWARNLAAALPREGT